MNAETLLLRLSGVRQNGPGKWMAKCPSHDDRSPSLSIRQTDDGKILIHCWSGCDTESVLTALGLNWRDIFPDRWREAEARALAHGHRRLKKSLGEITQQDYARHVVAIAQADVEAGKVLSLHDRATVVIAMGILRGGGQ